MPARARARLRKNGPLNLSVNNAPPSVFEAACKKASVGMEIAAVAALVPDRLAVSSSRGELTFKQLNDRSNQLARLLRDSGIGPGDAVALVCSNREEFLVVRFACHRLGVRLTPVNWHLASDELCYIVGNCDAKALILESEICGDDTSRVLADNDALQLKLAIGHTIAGFQPWQQSVANYSTEDIEHASLGHTMLYTSGTTGRPKGVLRNQADPQKAADMQALLTAVFQFEPETGNDCALVTGPLYHAGPFNLCMTTPLTSGIAVVLMGKFEAETTLHLIEKYRISHTFFVPTMMNRLLSLPASTQQAANIASMRFIIHGAAPCSVKIKRDMLTWFGPILWEMFAGTEGPGTIVSPQEWLAKPGTVGKPGPGQICVLDEQYGELPAGEEGQLYIVNPPDSSFVYYRDEAKTAKALHDGYFTAGDIGYLDEDGYLFLTGRSAEVIICGGVNIYPQEIDDVLLAHPAIDDVACVGVPHEDWGEQVKAIIRLQSNQRPSAELEQQFIAFCATKLAPQKMPRTFDYVEEIPRSEAGKIARKTLRDAYWKNRESTI